MYAGIQHPSERTLQREPLLRKESPQKRSEKKRKMIGKQKGKHEKDGYSSEKWRLMLLNCQVVE